jgi:excisionase family DNA binding protein
MTPEEINQIASRLDNIITSLKQLIKQRGIIPLDSIFLTIDEVAEEFKMKASTIRLYAKDIGYHKNGKHKLFKRSDVIKWIESAPNGKKQRNPKTRTVATPRTVDRQAIIKLFLKNSNLSQQQIAAITGYSKSAVHNVLTEYWTNRSRPLDKSKFML